MLAIILKDLRLYTNSRKYRIIQFIILAALTLLFFGAAIEFYAQGIDKQQVGNAIDVGKQTYTLFIICIFILQFLTPRHGVEAVYMERSLTFLRDNQREHSGNGAILALTPLPNWKMLGGKLAAVVIWAFWGVWFTIPLFALSSYVGGLVISQLVKCGMVILVSCIFFALVGIGVALWNSPTRAKGISYGFVLAITFLPLIPISPFTDIPMFDMLSPLCALLSILQSDATYLWIQNVSLFCVLCLVIFPVLCRRMS
ncbi:hypothetical protein J4G08_13790 [Candidatus Poribacteria bacterium]|nr:hypothetical protein [Candidatus Poribacteria bacterium]